MPPIVVGFILYPNVTLMDFVGASEVFAFAGNVFKPIWISKSELPVKTSEGLSVMPSYSFSNAPKIDILFIPGGGADGVSDAMFDDELQDFIIEKAETASWVGSVCTGAFILAAAQQYENCEITTYWSQIPNLKLLEEKMQFKVAEDYPRYILNKELNRFSGGGVSSSVDLALALVEAISGKVLAEQTQLSIQYAPNPPINGGDPSQAPLNITKAVVNEQKAGFIEPLYNATERLLKLSYEEIFIR